MPEPQLIEYQADRVARNPFYRWLIHLGVPTMLSLGIHGGILFAATLATIQVGTPPERIDVGEYATSLIDTTDYSGGLSFDEAPDFEVPEETLEDLDLSSLSDMDPSELNFEPTEPSDSLDQGFGLGEGDGGVIGIGETGIGAAGSGGLGGFGHELDLTLAGVWDLNVNAERVAYVVDFSGSIVTVEQDLVRELKRSIGSLKARQSFNVILFYGRGRETTDSFSGSLLPATGDNKKRFFEWIDVRHAAGGTNPVPAVLRAIKQRPQAIFFFSDGRFENDIVERITKANKTLQAQLVCLLFDEANFESSAGLPPANNEQVRRLKRLAEQNVGRSKKSKPAYKTVTLKDLYGN